LTSNLKRATAPGNVLLDPNEANLPKQGVVVISQIFTIDKTQLGDYIGTLSSRRVRQILDGIKLLLEPREVE
jgi:mRNA interferase MazF